MSLKALPGKVTALVGASGSGKTTLARCLAGLHRDHDGEILLDGIPLPRSLRDRSRTQLAAVQYVFQDARRLRRTPTRPAPDRPHRNTAARH
ncbi:ABC-type dipeptide/oligopeptide/nickel transport system ATPase subunit [Streptomyces sp. 3330]|nr:ABC-type dipeptide/oligopeptide/nickel transport system ATPase subunit [Streptomyces sp. 3330]